MKLVQILGILFAMLGLSACGKLFESNDKGLVEVEKIEKRWADGLQLAGSTSRISLSPQVASLQAIKRDLSDVAVSECMAEARNRLSEHMEASIQGFLAFMASREYEAEEKITEAKQKLEAFQLAKAKCK